MSENFNLEIILPEKILLKDQTTSVTIPSFEGDMTILKDHISLIAILRPGIIKIFGSKKAEYFVNLASSSLSIFKPSKEKNILENLTSFSLERSF